MLCLSFTPPDRRHKVNLVKTHFDKASYHYLQRSERGLWKVVRNREVRTILSLLPEITEATTALDLGCGAGFYSDILWQYGIKNITCVDFSEKMLEQIKNSKYQKISADIEEFKNNEKYDIILCAGVLEFAKQPDRIFKNIAFLLKKTGCAILLYPTKNCLGLIYQYYHRQHGFSIQLYNELSIKKMGETVGLNSLDSKYVFPFSGVVKQKLKNIHA